MLTTALLSLFSTTLTSPVLWADARDGALVVDVTADAGYAIDTLYDELSVKYRKVDAGLFDVQAGDVPAFLDGRSTLNAVTVRGVQALTPVRHELSLGAAAAHLFVYTDAKAKTPALIVLQGAPAKDARLRDLAISAKAPGALPTKVFQAIAKSLPAKTKKVLAAKRIGPASLKFASGSFPGKAKWLVWIDAPADQGEYDLNHFVYAALIGDDGKATDVLVEPELTIAWWRALYLVDYDGDGRDELIGQPYYYEGESTVMYRWDAGTRAEYVLNADGA